jgi:DNA-directed RNA polymerase specialized sigma24 family protein
MTFEEFADTRLVAVLRFAGVLTGDRALVEDVVQEVLIRARAGGRSATSTTWSPVSGR